ncbi:hypothetical protein SH2C18_46730 [Clostridium sediminicola]|uniref:DUF4179 domain-containing protein n=1 Tax=Clostridium sediminicola TaxID=3114879 RepID=UPI0031F1F86B
MNYMFSDFDKIKASNDLKAKIIRNIALEEKNNEHIQCKTTLIERIKNMLNSFTGVRKVQKRVSPIVLTLVLIFLSSTMAYAFSNIDYFKNYFGESIYLVEENIFSEVSSVSNEDYKLTIEGVLSDEYKNVAVVSLEPLSEKTKGNFKEYEQSFKVGKGKNTTEAFTYEINELEKLSNKTRKYYLINYNSTDEKIKLPLEVSLSKEFSEVSLEIPIAKTLEMKEIALNQSNYSNSDYMPYLVKISPLSVVVVGYERVVNYEIPNPELKILFKNGKELSICGNELSDFSLKGSRFVEDNSTIVSVDFEKIINLEMIESVIVDGVKYSVK